MKNDKLRIDSPSKKSSKSLEWLRNSNPSKNRNPTKLSSSNILRNLTNDNRASKPLNLSALIQNCTGFFQKEKHALFVFGNNIDINPQSPFDLLQTAVSEENSAPLKPLHEEKGTFKINRTYMLFKNFSESKFYSLINNELLKIPIQKIEENSKITMDSSVPSEFLTEILNLLENMGFSVNIIKIPVEDWIYCKTLLLFSSYAILSFSDPSINNEFYDSLLEKYDLKSEQFAKIIKCKRKIIIQNFEECLAYNEITFVMINKTIRVVTIEELEKLMDPEDKIDNRFENFISRLKSHYPEKSVIKAPSKTREKISNFNYDNLPGPETVDEWLDEIGPEDKISYMHT